MTLRGPGSEAAQLAGLLLAESAELRDLWGDLEIGVRPDETERFVHPEAGLLELNRQILVDRGQSHALMVYTAVPGTESHKKLQLLVQRS